MVPCAASDRFCPVLQVRVQSQRCSCWFGQFPDKFHGLMCWWLHGGSCVQVVACRQLYSGNCTQSCACKVRNSHFAQLTLVSSPDPIPPSGHETSLTSPYAWAYTVNLVSIFTTYLMKNAIISDNKIYTTFCRAASTLSTGYWSDSDWWEHTLCEKNLRNALYSVSWVWSNSLGSSFKQRCPVLLLSSLHPVSIDVERTGIYQTSYKSVIVGVSSNASQGNSFGSPSHSLKCKATPDTVN